MLMIGKAEHWTKQEILSVTAITGLAHAVSTILLGILIGLLGLELSNEYRITTATVAPLLLVFMGVVYFLIDFKKHRNSHMPAKRKVRGKSKKTIVFTLAVAMFFSPCMEIETYYFMAGIYGWTGITLISVIYLIVTVAGMLLLVALGHKGIKQFNLNFLEHHEKKITGSTLILLGLFSFYIN